MGLPSDCAPQPGAPAAETGGKIAAPARRRNRPPEIKTDEAVVERVCLLLAGRRFGFGRPPPQATASRPLDSPAALL
jgi:hypothetical protein